MKYNHSYTYTTDQVRVSFAIGELPDWKQQALFIIEGSVVRPVAYFKSTADAELFQQVFDYWRIRVNG